MVTSSRYIGAVLAVLTISAPSVETRAAERIDSRPDAVVAVIDSGINPYHSVFRDGRARAYKHPSTYIKGYPKNARAIRLTFDAHSYAEAVAADCKKWQKVRPSRLYWFPGTRIVGAISVQDIPPLDCSDPLRYGYGPILDDIGHGTMTASRAASAKYGGCRGCLIVSVQGFTEGVRWAARNSRWIDVQSNSWGPIAPVWAPVDSPSNELASPSFLREVEAAARKHLAFWATGNGVATRGGGVGHVTLIDPSKSPPSIVMVGGHDSGYVNTWPAFPPHVVADSCNSPAAYHNELQRSDDSVGMGTSSATPFAAGGAAEILREARAILRDRNTGVRGHVVARGRRGLVPRGPLADGKFTMKEWKKVLFTSATARPEGQPEDGSTCDLVDGLVLYSTTPVAWSDVPEDYPEYLNLGYGAVDRPARKRAFDVLRGRKPWPDRGEVDSFFEAVEPLRRAQYDTYTSP